MISLLICDSPGLRRGDGYSQLALGTGGSYTNPDAKCLRWSPNFLPSGLGSCPPGLLLDTVIRTVIRRDSAEKMRTEISLNIVSVDIDLKVAPNHN